MGVHGGYNEAINGTVLAPAALCQVENGTFMENGGVVALSEQEQRVLDEIENALYQEDPDFGKNVGSIQRGGAFVKVVALLILGLVLLVGGIALSQLSLWFVVMSVAGFVVMVAAGVIGLRGDRSSNLAMGDRSDKAAKKQRKARKSSLSSRPGGVEENFRRRFER